MGNNAQAIAAIGLHAHQLSIETIANNLTNVTTTGFKSGRVSFQQLMAPQDARGADALGQGGAVGGGVMAGGVNKDFEPGKLTQTSSPLDLAIDGAGMIEVDLPDGTTGYSRGGSLRVLPDGLLATAQGHPLRPRIQVPANYSALQIGVDGKVRIATPDQPVPLEVGQISMASFANPSALKMLADGTYVPSEASGPAVPVRAGEDGIGTLAQRSLEMSNVNMIDEMTNLIAAQRAFEMSSKAFTAADEMIQMANNLRR